MIGIRLNSVSDTVNIPNQDEKWW